MKMKSAPRGVVAFLAIVFCLAFFLTYKFGFISKAESQPMLLSSFDAKKASSFALNALLASPEKINGLRQISFLQNDRTKPDLTNLAPTATFSNTTAITIPAAGTGSPNPGAPANPYPSNIVVSGLPAMNNISAVTVVLNNFN